MRAAGYPMGPFELIDLIGVDVNLAVAEAIYKGLGSPDRLRPSTIQILLADEGGLGRKTGLGFYRYEGGRRIETNPRFRPRRPGQSLGPQSIVSRIETAILREARIAVDEGVATPADIDQAMRLGAGHPQGPFERDAGG